MLIESTPGEPPANGNYGLVKWTKRQKIKVKR